MPASFRPKWPLYMAVLAAVIFTSCTYTFTRQLTPKFMVDNDSLQHELWRILPCESYNTNGSAVNENGVKATILEIDLVNPQDYPSSDTLMNELGRKVAFFLKKSLADKKEFQYFKILFVKRTRDDGVTRDSWQEVKFAFGEI